MCGQAQATFCTDGASYIMEEENGFEIREDFADRNCRTVSVRFGWRTGKPETCGRCGRTCVCAESSFARCAEFRASNGVALSRCSAVGRRIRRVGQNGRWHRGGLEGRQRQGARASEKVGDGIRGDSIAMLAHD